MASFDLFLQELGDDDPFLLGFATVTAVFYSYLTIFSNGSRISQTGWGYQPSGSGASLLFGQNGRNIA